MSKFIYIKTIFSLFILFFISACSNKTPTKYYDLSECRYELANGRDYLKSRAIDRIVVIKKERRMYLYKDGIVKSIVPISLGKNPIGQKLREGDNRTPEGDFFINRKICSRKYYRSLSISYPRAEDIARAKVNGFRVGGNITIHAQPKWNADGNGDTYTLSHDWTQGCIAVTNSVMTELWYAVDEGVPITIK